MGLLGWLAVVAALVLVASALRAGAQAPPREIKPKAVQALPEAQAHLPTRTPSPAPYWDAARTVTRNALNAWLASAEVRGKVRGSAGIVSGEWLVNTRVDLPGSIHAGLRQAGAPEDVASALAQEVTEGWKAWIRGYTATSPAAFPTLAAVPGPQAPVTSAAVPRLALARGSSAADAALGPDLAGRIKSRLPNEPGSGPAVDSFAAWLSGRLKAWYAEAYLDGLRGGGPAPNYAPPYVPVGPVVGAMTGRVVSPTPF